MSEYGQLWQKVSDLRVELKRYIPGAILNTLEDAKRERDEHVQKIDQALADWAYWKRRMDVSDD
jgi:hypothetical protein